MKSDVILISIENDASRYYLKNLSLNSATLDEIKPNRRFEIIHNHPFKYFF